MLVVVSLMCAVCWLQTDMGFLGFGAGIEDSGGKAAGVKSEEALESNVAGLRLC